MICLNFLLSLAISMPIAVDVASNHVGNVFFENESIQFQVKMTADASISVIDYYGKNVYKGKSSAGESEIDLGKLSKGHYILTIKSGDESKDVYFAIIPSMENRPDMKDSAIATDLATSWLVKPEQFDDLAKLTKLCGLLWIRDRITWGELESPRGKWIGNTKYDASADIQTKNGLKVYQVFHTTPGWAQEVKNSHSFPDDLRDAYNFASEMAKRYKGKVPAWEVWNEPDISVFSDELGDSYSALLKAMYLGYKSADPNLLVLICSFAMGPGKFAETIFQNDVGDYFDVYNYHIYDEWSKHIGRALQHIDLMKRYGVKNKPVWLTEAGRPIKRQDDMFEYNTAQDRDLTEFLPKAIINSLSAGIDKYFWFILPYYRENDFNLFGLLRQDLSPTPGYCSMSSCTYALGEAKYLGRIDIEGVYAYVFERSDSEIAVALWTDEGKKAVKIKSNADSGKLINVMGIDEEIAINDGTLKVDATTSVKYLILPANSLQETLKVDYPREKPVIKPYDPAKLSPIVTRFKFPLEARDKQAEVYKLKKGVSARIGLEIYNFANQEFTCKIELQLPDGWTGALNDNEVTVSRMGMTMRDLVLIPDADMKPESVQLRINLINESGKVETFTVAWIEPIE